MKQEIEVKHPIDEHDVPRLRERLQRAGAENRGQVFERNVSFDDASLTLTNSDRLIRLRQDASVKLTFKGPRLKDTRFKNREELEVEVADFDTMVEILDRLGFRPQRRYEKERETWHYHDAEVVIDHLPFGWFLEVEGPPSTIEAVEAALSLDAANRNTKNYYEIYDEYCKDRGLEAGDIVFGR